MRNASAAGVGAYLRSFIWKYRVYVGALILLALAAGVFDVAVSYKIKEIIDAIATNPNGAIGGLVLFFVLYKLMHHGVYFLSRLLDIRYEPMILQDTISDMYVRTLEHSLHWFDSHLSGEVAGKIIDFRSSISRLIKSCFMALINIVTIFISLFFLIHVNAQAAAILGVFVSIYTPVIYFLLRRQMDIQGQYFKMRQKAVGVINDSISNIFGVKVIGTVATEFRLSLLPAVSLWKEWNAKTKRFDAFFVDNADTVMVTIMSAVQMYVLARNYQAGVVSSGEFAFIAMTTLNIHHQLNHFLERLLFSINPHFAQMLSAYSFVNQAVDVKDASDATDLVDVQGALTFSHVTFQYGGDEHPVLEDFSLSVKPGERVGIVGPSGAGKTTITKCLLRYFDLTSGCITIDGKDLLSITQKSLRGAFSVIPQDITMFHRSIRDNLLLAHPGATDSQIHAACKKAKIHDDIMSMKGGYDAIVGERGVKMSGGQRQRVAIARAILKDAPILIFDEATSALDTPTERVIQESIDELLSESNATVIAIAHRLSTLKDMDRIIVMDAGKIVEQGSHEELLQRNGHYQRLWRLQG